MKVTTPIFKIILTILLVLLTIGLGIYLFFGNKLALPFQQSAALVTKEELKIGLAAFPTQYNPTSMDSALRNVTGDVYEGLVKLDRNFKIVPSLAVSWGLIDQNTWEFQLRKNVVFHDGTEFSAEDVLASLDYARMDQASQLKDLLGTIAAVKQLGDKIRIVTAQPDPLLLNKLVLVPIFKKNYHNFEAPLGTGPYRFDDKSQQTISLVRADNYWGTKPVYRHVTFLEIPAQDDRFDAFQTGKIQILLDVPANAACSKVPAVAHDPKCIFKLMDGAKVDSIPSLDVGFFIFKQNSDFFNKLEYRRGFANLFDRQFFIDNALGFARPVGQFVSSGVFGFNPELGVENTAAESDLKAALSEILGNGFDQKYLTFDYPEQLDVVGQYVQSKFQSLGVQVVLNPLNTEDLQKSFKAGDADLYYLDWKSDLGDAADFLENFAHSYNPMKKMGQLNGFGYSNPNVDELLEQSGVNLNSEERLKQLQAAMKILVKEDIFGAPLFETDTIFATAPTVNFTPRLDGIIHPAEIM